MARLWAGSSWSPGDLEEPLFVVFPRLRVQILGPWSKVPLEDFLPERGSISKEPVSETMMAPLSIARRNQLAMSDVRKEKSR
jgi:hypothetical protein